METLEGILPGLSRYLSETLANEGLSIAAEKQRLHFVELLDVLRLRAPPRVPAPLPSPNVAAATAPSRLIAPLLPALGFGKQNSDQAGISAWKLADVPTVNVSAAAAAAAKGTGEQESIYNEVLDETDGSATRQLSNDDSSTDCAYEEPVSILSPNAVKQRLPAADNVAVTTEGSETDYEEYSGDDGDYEDGELVLAEASTEVETIQLPRVKSKKKKKGPPAGYLKPYDAITSRQYEGETFVRRNISWGRFLSVLSQNALYCYKSTTDLRPRVFLLLSGHDVLLMDKEKGRNNVLRISKPGTETLFLSCDTIEKANEWFKQLLIAARPENRNSADENIATTFYCGHDETGLAPPSAGASVSRHSSEDVDCRPYSPGPGGPSGAATLPPNTARPFVPEFATVPKAAPRKTATAGADGKKKGRITKLFGGTGGKKKGRLTMDLMQDYSSKRLSTDPDVVISGMLAVSSHHFGSSSRWEEASCLVRAAGTLECQCYDAGYPSLPLAEASLSLVLAECTVEPSSDKDRPLAMRLLRAGSLELTFMPCDRLEHGDWLAALFKYVGRGGTKAATAATGGSAAAAAEAVAAAASGSVSSSSSTSGSGDGVIQHSTYANVGCAADADRATADYQMSAAANKAAAPAVAATAPGGLDKDAGTRQASLQQPIYVNVDSSAPKLTAGRGGGAGGVETLGQDVDPTESYRGGHVVQQAVSRSAEAPGVAAAPSAVPGAAGRPGTASVSPASTSMSPAPGSPAASATGLRAAAPSGAAASKEQQQVSPTAEEERGGLTSDDGSSVLGRILKAEAMSKSSSAAARPRETTPLLAAAAVAPQAVVSGNAAAAASTADRLHPGVAASTAAAIASTAAAVPAARQLPPPAGSTVHTQHSTSSALPTALTLAPAVTLGFVPVARERIGQVQAEPAKAAAAAAPASLLSPLLSSSGSSALSTADAPAAGLSEVTSEFAPKKLTVSGGIARNRALFETPAAATVAGGPPSGKPGTSAMLAPEARWTGYKLAVAPAVAAGSASPSLAHARRRSSSDMEPSPLHAAAAAAGANGAAAAVAAAFSQSVHGSGARAGALTGAAAASCVAAGGPSAAPTAQPRLLLDAAGSGRPSAPAHGKSAVPAGVAASAAAAAMLDASSAPSKSAWLLRDSSNGAGATPPVDGRAAAAASSASDASKVDCSRKSEAKILLGSPVGKTAAITSGGEQPVVATSAAPSASAAVGAVDVRLESGDAGAKQQLEQHRSRLAELRKQRNQVRGQKGGAPPAERNRLEIEYRTLDDRCRELERLISDLEDVNLMHIKGKPSLM